MCGLYHVSVKSFNRHIKGIHITMKHVPQNNSKTLELTCIIQNLNEFQDVEQLDENNVDIPISHESEQAHVEQQTSNKI